MGIVGALDLHRRQITFRWQDVETGEVHRGRIAPAARGPLREWLAELPGGDGHVALEGTTGWRFVVEELGHGYYFLETGVNPLHAVAESDMSDNSIWVLIRICGNQAELVGKESRCSP